MADSIQYNPEVHNHSMIDVDGLTSWTTKIEGMIPESFSDLEDDIGFVKTGQSIDYTLLKNMPLITNTVNGKSGNVVVSSSDTGSAPAAHTHTISDVAGLQTILDSKANKKRQETYEGLTDSQGLYSVVYSTPFDASPAIAVQMIGVTYNHVSRVSSTKTGFTVSVGLRSGLTVLNQSVLSLEVSPASGVTVQVTVTSR